MPQGKVITVEPPLLDDDIELGVAPGNCNGSVLALESDTQMGIVKDTVYKFVGGVGNCCVENNTVNIVSKPRPDTVVLQCTPQQQQQY